jgi:hypothetical protein
MRESRATLRAARRAGAGHVHCGTRAPMRRVAITTAILLACGVFVTVIFADAPMPPLPQPPTRPSRSAPVHRPASVLDKHLLVSWYGSPWTGRMGVLGRLHGQELADGLKKQAAAYAKVSKKPVMPAYELIATVAQPMPGPDGTYRRRESREVIDRMLREARAAGMKLILDVQTGRSTVMDEILYLLPYLEQPDVYLALDPEFSMGTDGVPGRRIGTMRASEVNDAIAVLEFVILSRRLPSKVLIVHQFTTGMLPDKEQILSSPLLDVVLDVDGFGGQALKRSTYRACMRQGMLPYSGFKLFYLQDTNLFEPAEVLALSPPPALVIYQ